MTPSSPLRCRPTRLAFFLSLLCLTWPLYPAHAADASRGVFNVRDFGARGDGKALDTQAIDQAITSAHAAGGGVVLLPAGEYLSFTLHLRSHVTLQLGPGATLVAAEPPEAGQAGGYDVPEANSADQYQDFGHSHFNNSLIVGIDLEDVAILGPGRIFGHGLSRGNTPMAKPVGYLPPAAKAGETLPDVLAADGPFEFAARPELVPGPFKYPNARDRLPDGAGNKAIALKNCRNVTLRDFSVLHGGHFAVLATGVDNLTIDNLVIDTNRDGMDIDACSNVRISNCSVNSPWDDGICLKSSHALGYARVCENVTITNCFVSGYDEGTLLDGTRTRHTQRFGGVIGRIKLGTEAGGGFRNIAISNCTFDYSRGLALEQVDGGVLEDIAISNITMRDVQNAPVFIRLGARLRRPNTTEPGKVRRILINNLVAHNVSPDHGILIAGLPGHPIEDVVLSDIHIVYTGGGTVEQAKRDVPEFEKSYPDPDVFGVMPTWAIFARHVRNLQMHDIFMRTLADDKRAAGLLDDVAGARFSNVKLAPAVATGRLWRVRATSEIEARDTAGLTPH